MDDEEKQNALDGWSSGGNHCDVIVHGLSIPNPFWTEWLSAKGATPHPTALLTGACEEGTVLSPALPCASKEFR